MQLRFIFLLKSLNSISIHVVGVTHWDSLYELILQSCACGIWLCEHYTPISWCRAVRIAPFSNRLALGVPPIIQGLRCLANFEALRFSESIRMLAEKMVDRMVKNSSQSAGKYVSVHLRFETVLFLFLRCKICGFYFCCHIFYYF